VKVKSQLKFPDCDNVLIVTGAGSGRRTNRQSPEKLQYKRFIQITGNRQAKHRVTLTSTDKDRLNGKELNTHRNQTKRGENR